MNAQLIAHQVHISSAGRHFLDDKKSVTHSNKLDTETSTPGVLRYNKIRYARIFERVSRGQPFPLELEPRIRGT